MAEQPKSTISPTMPSSGVLERLLDYIDQPLNTEDPIQNLVSGVAPYVPGISTALARRQGNTMDEALSYLDVVGGGALKGSLFLVKRKKELEKAIKDIDTGADPILSKNPFTRISLVEELFKVKKQLDDQLQKNIGYEEMLKSAGVTKPDVKASTEMSKMLRANDDTKDIFEFFAKNKQLGKKPD